MTTDMGPDGDAWRRRTLKALRGSMAQASDAMLAIALHGEDRTWIESVILTQLSPKVDEELQGLALTCAGHVARRFGSVGRELLDAVSRYRTHPHLSGRAEDAWDDIVQFAGHSLTDRPSQ